jgi:MFS family permease
MNENHPPLLTRLRGLPRTAWILFLGTFLNKFGTFVLPFLTVYLTRRGFSLSDAGIAMSAYGIGSLMASILGGQLADSIGRRKTIVLSMFSVAGAMMLLSQSHNLVAIVGATWLAAMTGELYRPASSALLADVAPPELRVTAFSAYRMAFNAGFAFGPATAGFLAERGYFWLFVGDAGTSVLFGVIALAMLPRATVKQNGNGNWTSDFKTLTRDHEFHRVLLGAFIIGLVFLQISSSFSLHVTRLGFSTATYGMILSLNGVLVTFCELPMTSVTGRFRPWNMMALGYLLIAIGFTATAFAHTVPELIACVVIFTFGEMATFPVSSAYIAGLAPAHLRGRYMGAYSLTWSAALIFAPQIGLRLFAIGPKVLWLTCGVLGLIATAIAFRGPVKTFDKTTNAD